jgi:conjugal transfer pilus assembly protein TraF
MRAASLIALALLLAAQAACAGNSEKKGYWWGFDDAPADQDRKPAHPDLPPPPGEQRLLALYPTDVEKLIQQYRDYALWKMTPEHVEWYYRLQDFARRRANAFMSVTQVVMLQHPGLNMNTEYPETTPGIDAHAARQQQDIDALLKRDADHAALILLSRAGCAYCEVQRNTLRYFRQQHPGWQLREVDVDRQPRIKAKFSVDYTPTTVVILRGSQQWFPVAVGVESVTGLEQNLYRALRLLEGDSDPARFTLQGYQQDGIMDPEGVPK